MMRRLFALFLVCLMLLSLTACGSSPAPGSDGPSQPEAPAQAKHRSLMFPPTRNLNPSRSRSLTPSWTPPFSPKAASGTV